MKNKIINIAIIILSIFFVSSTDVFALNPVSVSVHDIEADTYVIGTHMFDTNRTYLSTEDIMWAARTIDTDSKDDMIIYYKDFNNEWINGRTGEEITVPSTFEIEEINGSKADSVSIFYIEDNSNYSIIDQYLYTKNDLTIIPDSDKNYTINFNAYNFENKTYDFNFVCKSDNETNLDLGTIPTTIEILNGEFALPITVSQNAKEGYYYCEMTLGDNKYNDFGINIGQSEHIFEAEALEIYTNDENYNEFAETFYPKEYNTFEVEEESSWSYDQLFFFLNPFIDEGVYNVEISATKNGKSVELKDVPTNINIDYSKVNGFSIDFVDKITEGNYTIEITIDNITEYFYLKVKKPVKVELETLYNKTDGYYIENGNIITNEKNKTYTATFNTTNLSDGTYNIKNYIEAMSVGLSQSLKSDYKVEVKDNKFTFDFVIPKTLPECDSYYIDLKLMDENNNEISEFIINPFSINGNKSTGLKFTSSEECGNPFGTVCLSGRNETTGGAIIELNFATQKWVSGFEIYSSDTEDGQYTLLADINDGFYHAELENEQSWGNIEVEVPLQGTKYFKVIPYILDDNDNKIYKEESNIIDYTDEIYSWIGFKRNPYGSDIIVSYDNEHNATITIESSISKNDYIDGYIISESEDNGISGTLIKKYEIDKNITFNEYNMSKEQVQVTIPNGETRFYIITPYININGEETILDSPYSIRYENINQ
ncbi:MAG: hypothetical protein IJO32_01670 [Bacilli bacterium]|nr:hypothetical protein [Bacilli bacterium]